MFNSSLILIYIWSIWPASSRQFRCVARPYGQFRLKFKLKLLSRTASKCLPRSQGGGYTEVCLSPTDEVYEHDRPGEQESKFRTQSAICSLSGTFRIRRHLIPQTLSDSSMKWDVLAVEHETTWSWLRTHTIQSGGLLSMIAEDNWTRESIDRWISATNSN